MTDVIFLPHICVSWLREEENLSILTRIDFTTVFDISETGETVSKIETVFDFTKI